MTRALLAALAIGLVLATSAQASPTQESILMDDPKIVYADPDRLDATLADVKRLGVDRIRVSVFWKLIAPNPNSTERPWPAGGGADPRNYSADKWDRYDRIVSSARKHGLHLLFSVTSPVPRWAVGDPPRAGIDDTFRPDAREFADFVRALGTRYSGSYSDEVARPEPPDAGPCEPVPTIPVPPPVCPIDDGQPPRPPGGGPILPRVDAWSVWNEPNHPGWLTPQWDPHPSGSGAPIASAAAVYRGLADAAWAGLQASGHGGDLFLLAETAPRGSSQSGVAQGLRPLKFVRELYCLDHRFELYRGEAARLRGCPEDGQGLSTAHPALFAASGWAHHPYAFEAPPARSDRVADHAVLADLERLTITLDRAIAHHGQSRRMPIWLTEYGYQTNPPDPYVGVPWSTHSRYLAEAELMAYRNPRVVSTAQFLLYDDAPLPQYPADDPRHWGTFQSGVRTSSGRRKSSYTSYQRTIHVKPARAPRNRRITVFGLYRPGGGGIPARIQFRRAGSSRWSTLAARSTNVSGFVALRPRARRSGRYRIGFRVGERTLYTRPVSFRLSR